MSRDLGFRKLSSNCPLWPCSSMSWAFLCYLWGTLSSFPFQGPGRIPVILDQAVSVVVLDAVSAWLYWMLDWLCWCGCTESWASCNLFPCVFLRLNHQPVVTSLEEIKPWGGGATGRKLSKDVHLKRMLEHSPFHHAPLLCFFLDAMIWTALLCHEDFHVLCVLRELKAMGQRNHGVRP